MNNNISNLMIFPSQKEHKSFENSITQFGWTRNRILDVKNRWTEYLR